MVLKALFLAIILYYLVRTAGRLIRALRDDGSRSRLGDDGAAPPRWEGNVAPRARAEQDAEDARYVDIS